MKYLRIVVLLSMLTSLSHAEGVIEVVATLIRVDHTSPNNLSQLELRQQVLISRNRGSEDLLKLSSVIESGKWATIKRGREFWYPATYSEAKVHQAESDDSTYSIPLGEAAPGRRTIILPNSPTKITSKDLGANLRVRAILKEDGLIYLEGKFRDVVFEGLSEETVPIKADSKLLIRQSRNNEIMTSHIDKPAFRIVEKDFGVLLPYSSGNSENAKRLRESKTKYTYFVPIVLGNTAFGAPGKIEIKSVPKSAGPVISTMMKATMVKDFFIRPQVERIKQEFGIIILEVKKIDLPPAAPPATHQDAKIQILSKFIESDKAWPTTKPVLTDEEFEKQLEESGNQNGNKIILRSGEQGRIEVTRDLTFPIDITPPGFDPSLVDQDLPLMAATPVTSKIRKVGYSLEVLATQEPDNMIRMKVKSSILAFEGFFDFGNPVMAVNTGRLKRLKVVVADENKTEIPVFPFRETETELLVPNGSHVAMTMIFDYHNINHEQERLLRFRKAKIEEVKTPRFLTVFLSPKLIE